MSLKLRAPLRRFVASFRLSLLSQLEYRFNLFTDAVVQPVLVGLVEVAIWNAIVSSTGQNQLGGFSRQAYLAYAFWGAFFGRVAANWMYQFRMIDEVESGSLNAILSRPISFYEFYFGQFMGYKFLIILTSFSIAVVFTLLIPSFGLSGSTLLHRLPLAITLEMLYLVFVYTMSFIIANVAFFFNRTHGLTIAINVALAMFSGELFPLDLFPAPYREWILRLPFTNAVFVPVGYLTGRVDLAGVANGFISLAFGILALATIAMLMWYSGIRRYSGAGA